MAVISAGESLRSFWKWLYPATGCHGGMMRRRTTVAIRAARFRASS
jgi:hypothetical protein